MLDLMHTFPILSFLGLFVATEGSLEAQGTIARCVWLEYPNVKKCILVSVPEASRSGVQACAIFFAGSVMVEDFSR